MGSSGIGDIDYSSMSFYLVKRRKRNDCNICGVWCQLVHWKHRYIV